MEDEIDEEKEKALNIIDQITGSTSKRIKRKVSSNSELILKPRYNPELIEDKLSATVDQNEHVQDPVLEQSFQTFYEVTDNLTESFRKKRKSGNHEFNFLAEVDQDDDDSNHSIASDQMESGCSNNYNQETKSDVVLETTEMDVTDNNCSSSFLFFFHSMSPELKNRLNESSFCRTST